MNKVIQIANICKGMCNTANPIPGRIYYPKGCSPALNTCGGGGEYQCIYGWSQSKTPLCTRTHESRRQGCQIWNEQVSRQQLFQHRYCGADVKPTTMDSRDNMKFIYKLPRGYYPGGGIQKVRSLRQRKRMG